MMSGLVFFLNLVPLPVNVVSTGKMLITFRAEHSFKQYCECATTWTYVNDPVLGASCYPTLNIPIGSVFRWATHLGIFCIVY